MWRGCWVQSANQGTSRGGAAECWVDASGCFSWMLGVWCGYLCWRTKAGQKSRTAVDSAPRTAASLHLQEQQNRDTEAPALQLCSQRPSETSGQSAQAFSQPLKADRPNGTTFASRRCAPRVLRTDHCGMILSSGVVVSQGSNGVGKRAYEHKLWPSAFLILATNSF